MSFSSISHPIELSAKVLSFAGWKNSVAASKDGRSGLECSWKHAFALDFLNIKENSSTVETEKRNTRTPKCLPSVTNVTWTKDERTTTFTGNDYRNSFWKKANCKKSNFSREKRRVVMAAAQNGAHVKISEDKPKEGGEGGEREISDQNGEYSFAVLGDLHLEPKQMDLFAHARAQIVRELTGPASLPLSQTRVFQLGDVGGYANKPGSRACFRTAVDFLDGFQIPRMSVLGNHDLEGYEFETDEENLAVWKEEFGQSHYWEVDLGSCVCLGLSTVRFRSATDSCHEVYIDDEQINWFHAALERNSDRSVFVFTHAPPLGSGLTSLQEVHVKNRCAWLNHSHQPEKFLEIVHKNPQIKLWFSGHFHLSHDYEGSISRVGNCLFVQTGVMGECNRDGRRHSRIVKGNGDGYQLYTFDHGNDSLRLDVIHSYSQEQAGLSPQRLWCSNLSYLTSCPGGGAFSPKMQSDITQTSNQFPPHIPSSVRWWQTGDTVLALSSNQLVQYDPATRAPVGIVCECVNGREVKLIETNGVLNAIELHPTSESVSLKRENKFKSSVDFQAIGRNDRGGFWKIFQVNKWQLKREKEAAARALAALAGPIPVPKSY